MPPGGGRDGCTEQDHPPETGHRGRDEDAPSHSSLPPFPVIVPVVSKQRAASLPDDVLIEILSRVPYRSLCRFKCVSKPWLALCANLDIHNRSPRPAAGFFFLGEDRDDGLIFHDLTVGVAPPLVDPALAFLGSYERISVEQCCTGGLLLCKCWALRSDEDGYSYVVCNPATEKRTVLPPIEDSDRMDVDCFMDDDNFVHDFLSSDLNGSQQLFGLRYS